MIDKSRKYKRVMKRVKNKENAGIFPQLPLNKSKSFKTYWKILKGS